MKPLKWLAPFSLIYGCIVIIRNWFFDIGVLKVTDVGVPVISVGNITAGGTGKTPIVSSAARVYRSLHKKTAIISRGYGRKSSGTVVVSDGTNINTLMEETGDEASMLAQQCPETIVIVDENRVRGARKAIDDFNVEVILLDDGFQHRSIRRTKDIVLVDSTRSPFETMMLPAGFRREPLRSLRRADCAIVTKLEGIPEREEIWEKIDGFGISRGFTSSVECTGLKNITNGIMQSLEMLRGHSVVMFSGIASPENFLKSVKSFGSIIKKDFRFPDHHVYREKELVEIIDAYHSLKADMIVTTEKDMVRLQPFLPVFKAVPLFALQIEAAIHQDAEWRKFLTEAVL